MSGESDLPDVPVVCPECDTRTEVPFDDLEAAIDRHNDQLHDGDEVARLDPEIAEHLLDRAAEDLGLLDRE